MGAAGNRGTVRRAASRGKALTNGPRLPSSSCIRTAKIGADPAVGVTILRKPGHRVEANEPLAIVHHGDETKLAAALEPEDSQARVRMRDRWRVVLVDEFQDTDPVQWEIFRTIYTEDDGLEPWADPPAELSDDESILRVQATYAAAVTWFGVMPMRTHPRVTHRAGTGQSHFVTRSVTILVPT